MQAVIFDMDGTLVDSVDLHAEAWQRTLRAYGHEVEFGRVRAAIGKGGDELMKEFLGAEEAERIGERMEWERGELFKTEYLARVRPFPGVRALFERLLAGGTRVALGSSGKDEELDHHKRLLDIADLDLVQTSSEDADRSKPHPDIFQAALDKLGVPPGAALVVGDTPHDATAASRAGIATIGVLCGGVAEDVLRSAGCVAVYDGPADLLARFDESPLNPKTHPAPAPPTAPVAGAGRDP